MNQDQKRAIGELLSNFRSRTALEEACLILARRHEKAVCDAVHDKDFDRASQEAGAARFAATFLEELRDLTNDTN